MGNQKQKWMADEEEASLAGIAKHGPGKWKNILKDPEFAPFLTHRSNIDLKILSEDIEVELKEAAVISIETEVGELDLMNIKGLCDQVLLLSEYRTQLYDYLKSKMNTIAPNLTALVGELVGARLIVHGGGLLNLVKKPGSIVQILGAEKTLSGALKTKHVTCEAA